MGGVNQSGLNFSRTLAHQPDRTLLSEAERGFLGVINDHKLVYFGAFGLLFSLGSALVTSK